MRILTLSSLVAAALLAGCTGDGDTVVQPVAVSAETPNSFLTYPNMQASLAAGSYRVVIGTDVAGSGAGQAYTLTLTRDDGSVQTVSGSWPATGSSGPGASYDGNASYDFEMDHAGGVNLKLDSAVNGMLFLTRLTRQANADGTPLPTPAYVIVAQDSASGAGGAPEIDLAATPISSAAYAQAYYDAVDPEHERDTLAKWKERNGFNDTSGNVSVTHVIFRDALDLGYGRDMYILKNSLTKRIAFYVNNFVVQLQPGSSSNYGPLNADAAISQDLRYLRGTNAIEFSPANEDDASSANGSMNITKFFTFDKAGNRITSADLDGRGIKHMPGMCWACHGGQTMPLDENGKWQAQALRSAKLNILGAADFEYSLQDGWHRDQQEARLRTVNSYVRDTYLDMDSRPIANTDRGQGKWDAHYALELVNGRYDSDGDGDGFEDSDAGTFNDDFVPAGWKQANNPTAGVDTELLFKRVVGPHCTACHSLQGRQAAGLDRAGNLGIAINFSSFEKFYAYRSRIADYVFRRGIMPLGLRNWESFWKDPNGAPAILASALGDTSLFSGGAVIRPGLPVARPGAARTVASPVRLDGSASYFAQSYHWEIVGAVPVGARASASLVNADTARPTLIAPANGDYQLRLTVTNAKGTHSATVTYTVDNTMPAQTGLTFVDDIVPILTTAKNCVECHAREGRNGIPVYWSSSETINSDGSSDVTDSNGIRLYQRIMERVDLRDPENSRLLRRPTSRVHGGDLKLDIDNNPADRVYYNTILNWIREGAVCGSGTSYGCPQ